MFPLKDRTVSRRLWIASSHATRQTRDHDGAAKVSGGHPIKEPAMCSHPPARILSLLALAFAIAAPARAEEGKEGPVDIVMNENALLAPWTGPYGGVPAFDEMDLEALKPALEAGMARQLEEIDAVADNPEPATFENTIVAMERAGRDLDRVFTYWGIWSGNLSTPEFRKIQQRDGAEAFGVSLQDHPERGPLRARQGGLRERRVQGAPPRSAASRMADLRRLRPQRRHARRRRRRRAMPRSTSGWPRFTRSSRTTCWPTRRVTSSTLIRMS